jgi:hypothetical protein
VCSFIHPTPTAPQEKRKYLRIAFAGHLLTMGRSPTTRSLRSQRLSTRP